MAMSTAVLCLGAAISVLAAPPRKPHVVIVLSDDLGYHDLGYKNGGITQTPHIDALVADGVQMTDYYTYKLCSPTRASIQSGRYPWGVGFYDMDDKNFGDGFHCIAEDTVLMPALMRQAGYATHAIGKWDVGYIKEHCLPTKRGYETFLGYYTACTSDYWYHGAPGGNLTMSKCGGVDFHDSTASNIRGAVMAGPSSLNNTYDQVVFTDRAVSLIQAHATAGAGAPTIQPFFLFLAYHNVHDTCQGQSGSYPHEKQRLNAPMNTVARHSHIKLDTWKVQAAMTTELDYGISNVTAALKSTGMYQHSVLILISDNGGPLDHSNNWPYRGGKASLWEGGVRVEALVHSPLLPASRRGVKWSGLAHSSDWYVTLYEGIAGAGPGAAASGTGPRAPDGLNLWPALLGTNTTSPRAEVIHRVTNRFFNRSRGDSEGQAARFDVGGVPWKLITDYNCNSSQVWQAWPPLEASPVPFGLTGGNIEAGTDHARATSLPKDDKYWMQGNEGVEDSGENEPASPDPTCTTGIIADYHDHGTVVCCPKECGVCGVQSECQLPIKNGKPCPCAARRGGPKACCVHNIETSGRSCKQFGPPCIVHRAPKPACLFNLRDDPGERKNLGSDPQHQSLLVALVARLAEAASSGPPLAIAFAPDVGPKNSTVLKAICDQQGVSGFLEPYDWHQKVARNP